MKLCSGHFCSGAYIVADLTTYDAIMRIYTRCLSTSKRNIQLNRESTDHYVNNRVITSIIAAGCYIRVYTRVAFCISNMKNVCLLLIGAEFAPIGQREWRKKVVKFHQLHERSELFINWRPSRHHYTRLDGR